MPVKTQALTGRLAPFRFMESPTLNGIAFTAQPQAQVSLLKGDQFIAQQPMSFHFGFPRNRGRQQT